MRTTDALRNEHVMLRKKLVQLEHWLPHVHAAPFTVLNLTRTISRRLHAHTVKEERLLAMLGGRVHGNRVAANQHFPDEHRDQQLTLACLLKLLAKGRECPAEGFKAYASHLIDGLREHMANEEDKLFPIIDRAVASSAGAEPAQHMHEREGASDTIDALQP